MSAKSYKAFLDHGKQSGLSNKTIMIIDDSPMMRQILYSALKAFGVGCIISIEEPKTAMTKLTQHTIDAIIVDWKMMPIHGIDFVNHIRRELPDPQRRIPILMCSGYTEMSRIIEARNAGISDFLCKPVTAADLYDKLHRAIFEPKEFIIADNYIGPKWGGGFKPEGIACDATDESNVIAI